MKKTLGALCAAALLGSLVAAVPTAVAAGDDVKIRPRALDRGPDVAIPHLEGRRVVDGDVSIRVRGRQRYLLGKAGDGYVLRVVRHDSYRLVRVAPGESQHVLVEGAPDQAVLSDDGTTVAVVDRNRRTATVDVHSAVDGGLLSSRGGFRGYPSVFDIVGDHVIVASYRLGTRDWNWSENTLTKVTEKSVYAVDLSADRMAYFTKDPYNGGCSVVTTLSRPRTTLWRSCRQAVLTFSPDGERVVTTYKLADGIGPSKIWERLSDGSKLASYQVRAYFGIIAWESPTELLLDAYNRKNGATVRCSQGECERASALRPTPRY